MSCEETRRRSLEVRGPTLRICQHVWAILLHVQPEFGQVALESKFSGDLVKFCGCPLNPRKGAEMNLHNAKVAVKKLVVASTQQNVLLLLSKLMHKESQLSKSRSLENLRLPFPGSALPMCFGASESCLPTYSSVYLPDLMVSVHTNTQHQYDSGTHHCHKNYAKRRESSFRTNFAKNYERKCEGKFPGELSITCAFGSYGSHVSMNAKGHKMSQLISK